MMGLTMIVGVVAEVAVFYFAEFATQAVSTQSTLVTAGRLRCAQS